MCCIPTNSEDGSIAAQVLFTEESNTRSQHLQTKSTLTVKGGAQPHRPGSVRGATHIRLYNMQTNAYLKGWRKKIHQTISNGVQLHRFFSLYNQLLRHRNLLLQFKDFNTLKFQDIFIMVKDSNNRKQGPLQNNTDLSTVANSQANFSLPSITLFPMLHGPLPCNFLNSNF